MVSRDCNSCTHLVTTELESTLEEVTSEGWANTGPDSSGALLTNDLAESGEHALVVLQRVELDSSLDARQMSASVCAMCVLLSISCWCLRVTRKILLRLRS